MLFANHSWYNTTLTEDDNYETAAVIQKEIQIAIETAILKQGPVHINIPFDEPLLRNCL